MMEEELRLRLTLGHRPEQICQKTRSTDIVSKMCTKRKLNHHKVLPGTLHGASGGTKFFEDRETGVFTKSGRGTKDKTQKLQGQRVDIGDLEVVRTFRGQN